MWSRPTTDVDRLISYFIALAVAAGLMFAWDRHPPIGWHAHVLFWRVGFDLPPSLAIQRDGAVAGLRAAQDGRNACLGQLGSQTASLAVLGQKTASAMARAERDLQAARSVAESYRQAAADLKTYQPQGGDRCARLEDADRAVVEALK
jgi:hypothetical protein